MVTLFTRTTISIIFGYLSDTCDIFNLMLTCKKFNKIGYQFFIRNKINQTLKRLKSLKVKMNRCDKVFAVQSRNNDCKLC